MKLYNNKYIPLTLSLILAVFLSSYRLLENPTSWVKNIYKVNDSIYLLKVDVTIEDHWHVYSHYINEGGPIPTSIIYDNLNNALIVDSIVELGEIIEVKDPNFGMKLKWYDHNASFLQKLKINNSTIIKGAIEFMACDEKQCLPPDYIDFEFNLPNDANEISLELLEKYNAGLKACQKKCCGKKKK